MLLAAVWQRNLLEAPALLADTTLGDGSLTQINPDTFEPIVIPGGGAVWPVGSAVSVLQVLRLVYHGAATGSAFGPVGTAVGAGIGLLGGLFG